MLDFTFHKAVGDRIHITVGCTYNTTYTLVAVSVMCMNGSIHIAVVDCSSLAASCEATDLNSVGPVCIDITVFNRYVINCAGLIVCADIAADYTHVRQSLFFAVDAGIDKAHIFAFAVEHAEERGIVLVVAVEIADGVSFAVEIDGAVEWVGLVQGHPSFDGGHVDVGAQFEVDRMLG